MSRKKLKNRRRKDRAQRKILIAAVCIAAVIIGVGIGGDVIKKNAGKISKIKRQYQRKKQLQKNLRSMRMKLMHPIKKIKAKKIRQMTEVNLQFNQEEKWVQQNNRMKKLSI